jgi:class 3 adenylate cyclase/predicted ATPase
MDVAAWLKGLGLERYGPAFRDNEIDERVLPSLTAEDLKDLGVTLVGHRRLLLDAIAALHDAVPAAAVMVAAPGAPAPADAERRQLTVMFCDLVGSTALSAQLDPEDLREVIGAYHRAVAEIVAGFDGFVAKYMGDGVLVYFGYPRAHEDDAERAVCAGLGTIDAVGRLDVKSTKLQARVGIATGLVVVGDLIGEGSAQEQSVVGETPNLAARLQALAEPDAVVIAAGTRRLVGDLFEVRDLGTTEVKGIAGPVPAWQVLRPSVVASRFEALHAAALTPLVGRDEELALLRRRWAQARVGTGRVVLISAEPGIGKSRLTEAFRESLEGDLHTRLRYFCSPHHQDSALFPFIGQLERAANFGRDDAPSTRLDKLEALIAANAPAEDDAPLLAELLTLPFDGRYLALDLTPQRKKEKVFEALLRQLAGLARRQPVLMIFEDLHWADPTSRELLDLTVEQIERMPVLLIATFRHEFQPPWTGQPHVTTLSLRRLGRDESNELVRGMIGNAAALQSDVVDEIVDRTDGVPLFLEELTKAVLENAVISAVPAASLAIPETLHASLMARLDRLGPIAKEIAQVGAAIGREFSFEVLAAVAQRSETDLRDALGRLTDAGLVFQRGVPPHATFLFKHALVQDTALGTLLRGPRQELHARIGRALEQQFPRVAEAQPQILAYHFTEAGLLEKAVAYWCRAGQQSAAKSALAEAIAQLRRGLRLIADLPNTSERGQQELDLQVTLAGALMGTKGYAHSDVAESFGRAASLISQTESAATILHFSVLYGVFSANFVGGEPRAALERAKEFLSIAQSQTESGPLLLGHRMVSTALFTIGDYSAMFSHAERAVALYVPEEHRALAFRFGQDIGVSAFCYYTLALWHLGYPDRASNAARETLRHARQSVHVHTLAYALFHIGITAATERRVDEVEECANELVALAKEHRFEQWSGYCLIMQGWAMARREQGTTSVERIREGLAATRETGARTLETIFLGLLAEALALTGEIDEGLVVLAEALAMAEASDARGNDAELHRLRGDLLRRLPSPDSTEVEACFRRGLAVARDQGTRGFELRAAVSLARLLSDQERRDEARDLLAPVYGWFTEGFDTADLKEAKVLLEKLA